MIIGVPLEIKSDENRVALLPVGAEALVQSGHRVLVESNAGRPSGALDEDYAAAGAEIVHGPEAIYGQADLVVKVKEELRADISAILEDILKEASKLDRLSRTALSAVHTIEEIVKCCIDIADLVIPVGIEVG